MNIMLDKFYYDALDEVGNIGMGNATTALSQIVGKSIKVSSSALAMLGFEDATDKNSGSMVGAVVKVVGDINGGFILMLNKHDAKTLSEMLLNNTEYEEDEYMKNSVVIEVANILAGTYYNALSKFLGINIIPSIPTMAEGSSNELLERCNNSLKGKIEHIFGLNTLFEIETGDDYQSLNGDMYMLLDSSSMQVLLDKIEKMRT
jgi:chemotaxis protein CheC